MFGPIVWGKIVGVLLTTYVHKCWWISVAHEDKPRECNGLNFLIQIRLFTLTETWLVGHKTTVLIDKRPRRPCERQKSGHLWCQRRLSRSSVAGAAG